MQVQDPQYIFRKRLAGTWKSKDSSCTVILDVYSYLEITYGGTRLSSSYSVLETNALYEANSKAMTGFFMGLTPAYKRHPGEELKVQMDNTSLSDDISNLYTVSSLWFGGEKLNIELTDSSNGQTTALVLTREGAEVEPSETAYVCECGYTGPFGKFCPNCGRAVEKEYTCQCGYRSKGAKFCPNCGRPTGQFALSDSTKEANKKPEPTTPSGPENQEEKLGWKCSQCGAENQKDKCSACGAEINPVVFFSISTHMSTNPPVDTFTNVYEYSDTQLLIDCNGKRRLISADILEPAMEIIRRNHLDDPDFKDPSAMSIMGGSVCVGFKDGDRFIQTSMQTKGFAVTNAQSELMELFNKA